MAYDFKTAWQQSHARAEMLENVLEETLKELHELGLHQTLYERWRNAEMAFNENFPEADEDATEAKGAE